MTAALIFLGRDGALRCQHRVQRCISAFPTLEPLLPPAGDAATRRLCHFSELAHGKRAGMLCPFRQIMNPDSETIGEDFLDFKCPCCDALNSFPAAAAGHVRECMNCVESFLVPLADGQPARPLPLPVETEKLRLRRFEATDW